MNFALKALAAVLLTASALAQIAVQTSFDAKGKVAGHIADEGSIRRAKALMGTRPPDFAAKDIQGKPISRKTLKGKPAVLFFLDKECPCCVGARVYVDRLQATYGKAAYIVGFVNGSPEETKKWAKKTGSKFRVVPDPGNKIGIAYRAEVGMACRLLDRNGKIVYSLPGYSAPMLQFLGDSIAKEAGISPRKINTKPAPDELTSGCPLIR